MTEAACASRRLFAVVPTFEEAENLPTLLEAILQGPENVTVVVVDDASPDGTGAIAEAWAARTGRVVPIHRKGKLGLASAYVEGFREARRCGATHVLTLDADLSHRPSDIPALAAAAARADLVVGSRDVAGGRVRGTPWVRRALSRLANGLVRSVLRLRPRDVTGGFRLYGPAALALIAAHGEPRILSRGYAVSFELLARLQRAGLRIEEVPIVYDGRTAGRSKLSARELTGGVRTLASLLMRQWLGRLSPKR